MREPVRRELGARGHERALGLPVSERAGVLDGLREALEAVGADELCDPLGALPQRERIVA
jgi:hypothetical protein